MATDATGTPSTNFSFPKYNVTVDAPSGLGLNAIIDAIDTKLKTDFVHSADVEATNDVPVWDGTGWVFQKVNTNQLEDLAVTNAKIANATIVATTKLTATGTKNSTTFLRGDDTYAVPTSAASLSARVRKSADETVPLSTTAALTWDTEDFDTDVIHDNVTNNSRLTCKTAGKYMIVARIETTATPADLSTLTLRHDRSGAQTAIDRINTSTNLPRSLSLGAMYDLAVNDFIEVVLATTGGGGITVESDGSHFQMASV